MYMDSELMVSCDLISMATMCQCCDGTALKESRGRGVLTLTLCYWQKKEMEKKKKKDEEAMLFYFCCCFIESSSFLKGGGFTRFTLMLRSASAGICSFSDLKGNYGVRQISEVKLTCSSKGFCTVYTYPQSRHMWVALACKMGSHLIIRC